MCTIEIFNVEIHNSLVNLKRDNFIDTNDRNHRTITKINLKSERFCKRVFVYS